MKSIFLAGASLLLAVSCAQSQDEVQIPIGNPHAPASGESVAYFAEGCFWHSEIIFQSLVGVRDAVSGYCGGTDPNPTYEKVETGTTGHAETVAVYYDPKKVSYATLVKAFFASMDPTELNRQGNDEGTQYRSIAFYQNDSEKQVILAEIKRLTEAHKYSSPIVTEVVPFVKFYPAEAYHQEYVFHHPDNGYVAGVCIPEYLEFRRTFQGNFK